MVTVRRQHRRRLHDDLLHANNFYLVPLWSTKPLFTSLKLAASWEPPACHPAFSPCCLTLAYLGRRRCIAMASLYRWLYQKLLYFLYKGLYSDVALSRCIAPIQRCIVYSYTALYSIQPIHPPSDQAKTENQQKCRRKTLRGGLIKWIYRI